MGEEIPEEKCFLRDEGALEDKNLIKSVKIQHFKSDTFFVKENNIENKTDYYRKWKIEIESFTLVVFTYFSYWLHSYLPLFSFFFTV